MMEKDYSKLRPFDLEAAKSGEPICTWAGCKAFFIGINQKGCTVVEGDCGSTYAYLNDNLRMAPLAWVEGKPVYKGDVLYSKCGFKGTHRVDEIRNGDEAWMISKIDAENGFVAVKFLTWNPPKVKREGYTLVQKESVHKDKRDAESFLSFLGEPERWAICHVEWEE